jgi:hypothetical protein
LPDDNVHDLFGEGSDNTDDEDWASFSLDEDADVEEPDPSTVAFMDQQSAEFNAKAEHEFADRYGFVHKCRCDQDYTEGKLVEVTECYANMTLEALDTCARLHKEVQMLTGIIAKAVMGGISVSRIDPNTVLGELDPGSSEDNVDGDSSDETPE